MHMHGNQSIRVLAIPAEVQQGSCGAGDAVRRPAEQVELSQCACLLCLHILQVKTTHQKVLTPDVLRHQVHLRVTGMFSKHDKSHLVLYMSFARR